ARSSKSVAPFWLATTGQENDSEPSRSCACATALSHTGRRAAVSDESGVKIGSSILNHPFPVHCPGGSRSAYSRHLYCKVHALYGCCAALRPAAHSIPAAAW